MGERAVRRNGLRVIGTEENHFEFLLNAPTDATALAGWVAAVVLVRFQLADLEAFFWPLHFSQNSSRGGPRLKKFENGLLISACQARRFRAFSPVRKSDWPPAREGPPSLRFHPHPALFRVGNCASACNAQRRLQARVKFGG